MIQQPMKHYLALKGKRELQDIVRLYISVPHILTAALTPTLKMHGNTAVWHYLPITPHIYFTQFMDDTVFEERETAIFMNLVLMSKCVELWVFGDTISAGMKAEIERAERKHMKIRYFTEELEEKE